MSRSRAALCLGALMCVSGCATRADFERLKRDQQEMRAQVADMQVSLDGVNRRLDTMRSSMDEKGGGRETAAVKGLERRVAEMEARLAQQPPPTDPGVAAAGGDAAAPTFPRTDAAPIALRRDERLAQSGTVNEGYRRALQLYREGQAEQSIQQFREFLRANPKSDLADNAQYWMGEAYYSRGDYNRSIIELNEVLLKYPQGDQVPGALLALATSFANSGDKIDAKLILQKLISDHPKSEEAEIGRQQLQSLAD
ncbi:MAG: tol-pal system protein YbgF [Candidatus Binatia bacterium]